MTRAPHRSRRFRRPSGERGILLVALLVGMTVMMILVTASAQSWSAIMKREREEELLFRGNQYVIALKAYQAENGGQFPTKLEQLMEEGPRGHRYIRQLFKDPFSKDGEWNLLYLGPDGKSAWNPNARMREGGIPGLGGVGSTSLGAPAGLGTPRGVQPGLAGAGGLQGGVPGQPGVPGQQGLPVGQGMAPMTPGVPGSLSSTTAGGLRPRQSRFDSGNLNSPIVGVVSKGKDKGFQEYFMLQYYDEWEFHVFIQQVQEPQGQPTGLNINPQGGLGPGGNINPVGFRGQNNAPGEVQGPKRPGGP